MAECLIVYYSYHHGNTEMVAREMAAAVGADLCTVDGLAGRDLTHYEFLGFGAGIAFGRHYEKLFDAVNGIDVKQKTVFVFSTCGNGIKNQNNPLVSVLEKKGANVAGSFSCRGFDTCGPFKLVGGISKGHPNEDDFEAARQFIRNITEKPAR